MGAWGPGVFDNDYAMDFVGEWLDNMMSVVHEFMVSPEIDELFDPALAAISVVNDVMERSGARAWDAKASTSLDPAPIVAAMRECWGHIDELDPDPDYKIEREKILNVELERFSTLLAD